jgi:hypothetical protein
MEPLSALSSTSPMPRPAPVVAPDLASVLRDGRVVQGEVLQSFGGGGVLVGIGRHRVPADAGADAKPGDRLWFAVRSAAGGAIALRALAGGDAGTDARVARALHALVGDVPPRALALATLAAALAAHAAGGHPTGVFAERLRSELAAHAFRPGDGGAALADLVRSDGTEYEARLAASDPGDFEARAASRRDLKSLLLSAIDSLPDGAAKTAAEAALHAVEADQLANLLRRGAGEAARHAIAVQDGARGATAYLEVDADRERRENGGERDSQAASRVSLAIDLDRLGSVRAEIARIGSSIAVRVEAGTDGAVERLRDRIGELRERLSAHAADVHVAVALAPDAPAAQHGADAEPRAAHVVDLSA